MVTHPRWHCNASAWYRTRLPLPDTLPERSAQRVRAIGGRRAGRLLGAGAPSLRPDRQEAQALSPLHRVRAAAVGSPVEQRARSTTHRPVGDWYHARGAQTHGRQNSKAAAGAVGLLAAGATAWRA